jgi:hypothetical protein
MMARPALRFLVAAVALVAQIVAVAPRAGADSRVQFLAERLKYPPATGQADDFRVRTNAALALGATNDDAAVEPLCAGLSDPSDVVRQAAAVGLKRLARPRSVDCLRKRVAVESSASVKVEIERAIDAAQAAAGGGSGDTPPAVAGAKYYVSIPPVTNATGRATTDVDRLVRDSVASKLRALGEYQLAPAAESSEAARAIMARRSLKGFYLAVSVEKFDYSDGNLRVRLKIAVFSYPGRDLRGEVPAGATVAGVQPGDRAAEDQLMGVVAARAAELFAQNFR